MSEASVPGNNVVMNAFEALLNKSGLANADQIDPIPDRYETIRVE